MVWVRTLMSCDTTSRRERMWILLLSIACAIALTFGWHLFWYICDDAYIAFRYVSNRQLGFGYTWNAPPFRPVEGYTSFLWVVVLDVVWTLFGADPTKSANVVSLLLSYGTLAIVIEMAWRASAQIAAKFRIALFALLLFSIVSNRTFLAWTTSGLETPLETFLVLGWVRVGLFTKGGTRSLTLLCAAAATIALCRPDGILFCAATLFMIAWHTQKNWRGYVALTPLVLPIAHTLWRHHTYGFWLPNTYYAKHVAPWPIGGLWYLANFTFEYAYYFLAFVALLTLVNEIRKPDRVARIRTWWKAPETPWLRIFTILTIVAHAAYYTLIVGGDHFEYRVYHHLVPLLVIGFPWLTSRMKWPAWGTLAAFSTMTLVGLFLPWAHWWFTHTIDIRRDQGMPHHLIAPHFKGAGAAPFAWYARRFDKLQRWPMRHFIGLRHQTHKVFLANFQTQMWPSREEGSKITSDTFPIVHASAVGYPAWVLPHVAVIDRLGLNDAVVAHSPAARVTQEERLIAHDRHAPEEYLACFKAMEFHDNTGPFKYVPRDAPFTAEDIRACENTWWRKLGLPEITPP